MQLHKTSFDGILLHHWVFLCPLIPWGHFERHQLQDTQIAAIDTSLSPSQAHVSKQSQVSHVSVPVPGICTVMAELISVILRKISAFARCQGKSDVSGHGFSEHDVPKRCADSTEGTLRITLEPYSPHARSMSMPTCRNGSPEMIPLVGWRLAVQNSMRASYCRVPSHVYKRSYG